MRLVVTIECTCDKCNSDIDTSHWKGSSIYCKDCYDTVDDELRSLRDLVTEKDQELEECWTEMEELELQITILTRELNKALAGIK